MPALHALHAELQSRGARLEGSPRAAFYGLREIRVEDLNGYRLIFGRRID